MGNREEDKEAIREEGLGIKFYQESLKKNQYERRRNEIQKFDYGYAKDANVVKYQGKMKRSSSKCWDDETRVLIQNKK